MEYTQNYEYACSLVTRYIVLEELLDQSKDKNGVYGDTSLIKTLFTTDYSLTHIEDVRKSVERNLSTTGVSGQHMAILTRLRTTYVDICSALGYEFMEKLKKSVAAGLVDVAGISTLKEKKRRGAAVSEFIEKYPIVVLFVIGSKEYAKRLLTQRSKTQTPDIQSTDRLSRPAPASRTGSWIRQIR